MSAPDPQQPPPPPPPPSGSPFGRFLTSPVLLVSVAALVVGVATFASLGDGGGGSSTGPGPSEDGIAGSWQTPTVAEPGQVVRLELTDSGGTLAVDECTGDLTPRGEDVFAYEDTSGERGCPRRARVTVTLEDEDTLRFVQRSGGRTLASGTLRR